MCVCVCVCVCVYYHIRLVYYLMINYTCFALWVNKNSVMCVCGGGGGGLVIDYQFHELILPYS